MSADEFNWMQQYAASEAVEHAHQGTISRREMLTRLVAIGGSATAAAALLAACGGDDGGSTASTSTSSRAPSGAATPGSTLVTPPTNAVPGGAVLSVDADDPAIEAESVTFPGPAGTMQGYLAKPVAPGSRASVIVIHEIFGLTDHIRDVARRVAKAGYLAIAPDLASRAGGTDNAANVAGTLTQGPVEDLVEDLDAAYELLQEQPEFDGNLGVVGFCFGGGMTLSYAAAQPDVRAAVPYYGPTPQPPSVMGATNAAVLAQYGETDERVNAGRGALEQAMEGKTFRSRVHPGVGHAFNNDTGGSYDEPAAVDAWGSTLEWFSEHLARRT